MLDTIKTKDLVLRPPVLDDAVFMSRHLSDPDIACMTGTIPCPYPDLAAEFWIMKQAANRRRGVSNAYVITKPNGICVGIIEAFDMAKQTPEIGYWVAKPYWGQGIASRAAAMLIEQIFSHTAAPYIIAGHFSDNPASGRVLQKLGFQTVSNPQSQEAFSVARGRRAKTIELRLHRPASITPDMQTHTNRQSA